MTRRAALGQFWGGFAAFAAVGILARRDYGPGVSLVGCVLAGGFAIALRYALRYAFERWRWRARQ